MRITADCQVTNRQVVDRLTEIEKLLNTVLYSTVFKIRMDGYTFYVNPTTHKLPIVRDVEVFDPVGNKVETSVTVYPDRGVRIDSNVNLLNSMLIIF